ncbi:gonadal somatic cell derived factor [Syngnathoides biaculeatus]|uniref:gonadal somatic cell derived factor n=1 Tax=Syngnathoides biaculeatus TaxID=300417 RepID=UPI002ADDAE96|nr:gonadal somatic cell derived factor [Syngnathoides biaculeatus]
MSFAFVAMTALMCSSAVIAIVLQPSKQEAAMTQDSNGRYHGESLQSIRKELLSALNLQTEPRLPEGAGEQWRGTAGRLQAAAASSVSGDGRETSGCCTETSEVFMTDLGWDNWVIHPQRLTLVHCAPCGHREPCRPQQPNGPQCDDSQVQAPCCQPTGQEEVNVLYMDESNTVTLTSMRLTRRCGCSAAPQPRGD